MVRPDIGSDVREIDRIRASSRRALLERDWDAWARDVADEFYGTTQVGTIRTKADAKRDHEAGTWAGLALDYDEIEVRVYGDVAVEVGRVRSKGGAGRYLLIFARRPSGWQLVGWHWSLLDPDLPAVLRLRPPAPALPPDEAPVAGDPETVAREVRLTNARLDEAMATNDLSALDRLVGDDCVFTDEHGFVSGKPHRQATGTGENARVDAIEPDDVVVRLYGNAGIVTGRSTTGGNDGSDAGEFRYTRLYLKRGRGWELVAAHTTRVVTLLEGANGP